MTFKAFETRTYGKWILAGEHAVIRGTPALVFPLLSKELYWKFIPSNKPLEVRFLGARGEEMHLLFWGVIENALAKLGFHVSQLQGEILIDNALPVGGGLGASAALCGAVGQWCASQGWIEADDVYEFSRQLENLFHGESSGVDIAVALCGHGLKFVRGGVREKVEPKWWPRLYLSYSGQRGMTSECVERVKALFQSDLTLAEELDRQMGDAVELAIEAFSLGEDRGFEKIQDAIRLARDCFERWGLVTGELKKHIAELEAAGAVAVKPTGSGGGGYALSLWKTEPPATLASQLISLR